MHTSNNRSNHDFQIGYFLIGACHTPDAAYALLSDLFEGRDNAIKCFESSKLRVQAKIVRANRLIASDDEADQLDGQADLSEIAAMSITVERNIAAANAERAFIQKCMDALEPVRKYAHLTLPEAHEATQRDEWKFELMERAENCLLTGGGIPADQFATMRMHPDFDTDIVPVINNIQGLQQALQNPNTPPALRQSASQSLMLITSNRTRATKFELPKLAELLPNPDVVLQLQS
jgi:hypothetical protein